MSGLLDRIFPRSGASSQPKDTRTPSPNAPVTGPQAQTGETGVLPQGGAVPGAGSPGGAGLPGQAPPYGARPADNAPAGAGLPGQAPPFGAGPGVGSPGGAGGAAGGPGSDDDEPQRKGLRRRRRKAESEEPGLAPAGDGAPTTGTAQLPVVPGVSLEPAVLEGYALDSPGFAGRPKLRRRLRYLRKLRELLLRDLGGFVFDARRFQRPRDDLVAAKIQRLAGVDTEIGALESALDDRRPLLELREPGIGGMCERCGAFFSSTSRFCSECGASLGAQGHAVPAAPSRASAAPAQTSLAASAPASPAARLAAEAASARGRPPAAQSPAAQPPAQPPGGGLWSAPAPKAGGSRPPRPGRSGPGSQTPPPPPPPPPQDAGRQSAPGAASPPGGDSPSQDDPTGPPSLSSGDPLHRR